eukprot:3459360-Amphidinium_carterae.1
MCVCVRVRVRVRACVRACVRAVVLELVVSSEDQCQSCAHHRDMQCQEINNYNKSVFELFQQMAFSVCSTAKTAACTCNMKR